MLIRAIYIWCVSKLGNIFKSPTAKKKNFERPLCKKYWTLCKIKICPWEILPQRNQKYFKNNVFLFLWCTPYAQSWVFFQYFQNTAFWWLYYSACKKATAMFFIWGDRGYPAVRFEYKTASEQYLVAEIWAKQFWVFLQY